MTPSKLTKIPLSISYHPLLDSQLVHIDYSVSEDVDTGFATEHRLRLRSCSV